jgi:hypothetical protein
VPEYPCTETRAQAKKESVRPYKIKKIKRLSCKKNECSTGS